MVARRREPEPSRGVRIAVRLTPRGGSDHIDGAVDGILRVRVAAPPADGAANASLLRLLAVALDVPRTALRLVSGASSRLKIVGLEDGADSALEARIEARIEALWPGLRQ